MNCVASRVNPATETTTPASLVLWPTSTMAKGTRYRKLENAIVFMVRIELMITACTDLKSQRLSWAVFITLLKELQIREQVLPSTTLCWAIDLAGGVAVLCHSTG